MNPARAASEAKLSDLHQRQTEAEQSARRTGSPADKAAAEKAAQERLAAEKDARAQSLAAHRRLFESVQAAITQLEADLGVSPREARLGRLGEFVALLSSAGSEGLQFITNSEQQRG